MPWKCPTANRPPPSPLTLCTLFSRTCYLHALSNYVHISSLLLLSSSSIQHPCTNISSVPLLEVSKHLNTVCLALPLTHLTCASLWRSHSWCYSSWLLPKRGSTSSPLPPPALPRVFTSVLLSLHHTASQLQTPSSTHFPSLLLTFSSPVPTCLLRMSSPLAHSLDYSGLLTPSTSKPPLSFLPSNPCNFRDFLTQFQLGSHVHAPI